MIMLLMKTAMLVNPSDMEGRREGRSPRSQPEALLDERFLGIAALVGPMAFFNFDTEQGVGGS